MKLFVVFVIMIMLFACQMDEVLPETIYSCNAYMVENPANYPQDASFKTMMSNLVASGVPGMQLSVRDSKSGLWSGAEGYSDLASNVKMKPCQITRVGSTVKTFTAVSILLLQEDGKLDIEEKITDYLTSDQIRGLKNAEKSTIEQLMKHSSGIYNYIQSAQFQTASLNDLEKVWQPDELLEYAREQNAYFEPGTDVLYSNTNFILLGMIIEKVTGKPFYEFFEDRIFDPLGMKSTRFAAEDPVPEGIVRGYVDFYSNFNLINSTYYSGWDYFTADGGLISNAYDLNIFLHALFNGQVLTGTSMDLMLDWQQPDEPPAEGFITAYGLGIFEIQTENGPAYIHSGDAIGYFASMVHFPNQNVTITWTANGNYGKIDEYTQSKEAMETIFSQILE